VTNAPIIFTKDTFTIEQNFAGTMANQPPFLQYPLVAPAILQGQNPQGNLPVAAHVNPPDLNALNQAVQNPTLGLAATPAGAAANAALNAAHEQAPQLGQHAAMLPPQGLPQALPVVPQGVTPFPGGLSHSSFSTYFYDETKDVLRQRYAAVLERFDPSSEASQGAEALLEAAIGNPNIPCTYLCVAALHGSARYRVYILHTISKYTPSIDGQTTPWDNKLFAFLGDTFQGNALSVIIPSTVFNTVQCQVYNNETFTTELPNLNNGNLFPRLGAGNQDAMACRTRHLMYLPAKYAPLLLNNNGHTLQEAWNLLIPALQADGLLNNATAILNWFHASLHATHANNLGPPVTAVTLVSPFVDQNLADHRQMMLYAILPALKPQQDPSLNAAIVHMANAVATQATEAQTARLAREIERDQPTLPSTKFAALFSTLKACLNVNEETELPEFWFTLAATPKKQEFSVIRDLLEAFSRSPHAFLNTAPIPSPKLVSDLSTITLVADHPDDLKTGLQPYIVMDGSEDYRLATQDIARNYALLSERDFSLSYADLSHFKVPKDLRGHPVTFFELEKSLGMFGNLISVVLGTQHPITTNFRVFWDSFTKMYRNQLHFEIDDRRVIKPVHILRNVQLICFHWFTARKHELPPPSPQFQDILLRISLATYQNPTLPCALYQLIQTKPNACFILHDFGKGKDKDDDTGTTATGLSSLSSATGPTTSNLSAHSGTSAGTSQLLGRAGTFLKNPSADPALQGLLPNGIKIMDLVGSDQVPLSDDNAPICLSYHIKGGCFSDCRRKDNHAKPLSADEKNRVSNWIVDQLAKLRKKFGG
jgi:hypothetical protein